MIATDENAGAVQIAPRVATALGCGAVLLWSGLAPLTSLKGPTVPPLQTTALTFAVGGVSLLLIAIVRRRRRALRLNGPAVMLGVYGLFGFHVLYFAALMLAPVAEASLIASLWALFTVVFSGFLPGQHLRLRHFIGAVLGLVASALLVGGEMFRDIKEDHALGLLAALGCAVVWASYSVMSRLLATVPSESLAWPCLVTAVMALFGSLSLEEWSWPANSTVWAALVLLGLGPVGGAFLLWDIGMKHGQIALLGILSIGAPILSTGLLVLFGMARPSAALAIACAVMVAAVGIAAGGRDHLNKTS